MVDAILLYVCTLSFSMSEWYIFALFSVFIGFWPRHCFKLDVAVVLSLWGSYSVLECEVRCPCGAHTLYLNMKSVVPVGLILCTLMWSPLLYVYVVLLAVVCSLVFSNSSLYNRHDQFSR
jgi:hypothetical protein